MLKIAAVVVFYNPGQEYVQNVLTYASSVGKVYVVDNSSSDNSSLVSGIKNVKYVANLRNVGIAKALNIGCELAMEDGYKYVLTMDQDSSWNIDYLQKFYKLTQDFEKSGYVSFAPILNPDLSYEECCRMAKELKVTKEDADIEEPSCVITSGNIVLLEAWDKVGRFYEPMFIDEVDHEFCYRLWENGYKIVQFKDIILVHSAGRESKKRDYIFIEGDTHKGMRVYYIMRNRLYQKKLHPDIYKKNRYFKQVVRLALGEVLNFRFHRFIYLFRAWRDAKLDRMGSYYDLYKK